MDIKDVLREMREYGADGDSGYSLDIVYACSDAIEAAMREKDAEIEEMKTHYRKICKTTDRLSRCKIDNEAEIERLNSALRHISLASQSSMSSKEECGRIARAAIAGKEDKT